MRRSNKELSINFHYIETKEDLFFKVEWEGNLQLQEPLAIYHLNRLYETIFLSLGSFECSLIIRIYNHISIYFVTLQDTRYLIIASDGLWDVC
jgi:hypothetical protein